jgi:hypothetical protein
MKPRWGEVHCRKCHRFMYRLVDGQTPPDITGPICSECMKNRRFGHRRRWKGKGKL